MLKQVPRDIKTLVRIASSTFINGKTNNAHFKWVAKTDSHMAQRFVLNSDFAYMKEPSLLGNANYIPGSNLTASSGPMSLYCVRNLMENTVFNATRRTYQVVALGDVVSSSADSKKDFFDYCLTEGKIIHSNFQDFPITIDIRRQDGVTSTAPNQQQVFPHGIVNSNLKIERSQVSTATLSVVTIELRDGHSFDFSCREIYDWDDNKTKNAKLANVHSHMELIWQLHRKSLDEQILVHCSAGMGRTGHLILILEILKNYESIFFSQNPEDSANKIHELLSNMRSVRPGLVLNRKQFESAIMNSYYVYQYALEKCYVSAPVRTNGDAPNPLSPTYHR